MLTLLRMFFSLLLIRAAVAQLGPVRNPHTLASDITEGAKTFRSHCAACHGLRGEGGRGPNLAAGIFYHGSTDSDLARNIANGIEGTEMPGSFYSADRISQVVLYIRSLRSEDTLNLPGDVLTGRRLYIKEDCASCHRIAGEGGRLGPDLTGVGAARSAAFIRQSMTDPDAEVQPRYWTANAKLKDGQEISGYVMSEDTYDVRLLAFDGQLHSLSKNEIASYDLDKHSKMQSYRDRLNGWELDDLVAHLRSLKPVKTRNALPGEATQ